MYNIFSFTLPVPAVSHGHRGGDGVAAVEVTPCSTHPLRVVRTEPMWIWGGRSIYPSFVLETVQCTRAQGISTVSTGRKDAPSPRDALKFSRGAKQGHLRLFRAPLSDPRHCCDSEERLPARTYTHTDISERIQHALKYLNVSPCSARDLCIVRDSFCS